MDIKKVITVGKIIETGAGISCHVAIVLFNEVDGKYLAGNFSVANYHGKSVIELAVFILNEVDFTNANTAINGDGLGVSFCQYMADAGIIFDKLNWGKPCFRTKFRNRFFNIKSRCCYFLKSIIDSGFVGVIGEFEFKKEIDAIGKIKARFVGRDALATEAVAMAFYDESMSEFVVLSR